jgi:hypothetical protein
MRKSRFVEAPRIDRKCLETKIYFCTKGLKLFDTVKYN